jgi:hypothetical protein
LAAPVTERAVARYSPLAASHRCWSVTLRKKARTPGRRGREPAGVGVGVATALPTVSATGAAGSRRTVTALGSVTSPVTRTRASSLSIGSAAPDWKGHLDVAVSA